MKVVVDHEKCQGHAICMDRAPDAFVLDDEGYNRMEPFELTPEIEKQVRKAVALCPEKAISIVDD